MWGWLGAGSPDHSREGSLRSFTLFTLEKLPTNRGYIFQDSMRQMRPDMFAVPSPHLVHG